MIYALNDQNERINASKAVKEKSYLCPNLECKNRELILKKGSIRIPHFAHKSQKDCYSEPESEAHISCKIYFQSLLELDNRFVEYYGIEGVRPDVLYDQFALEIQCSPITVNEVKRRNRMYEKNGYIAVWIFLEDKFTSIKKTKVPQEKSERDKKLERHGIRPETPIESKILYRINYRVKKPVLKGSFQDIERKNFKFFSFKYENGDIHVNFNDYAGFKYFDEFTKENEVAINTKQDFDSILEEILILNKNKKDLRDLKKKLNNLGKELNFLPKQIQGNLFESLDVNIAHVSGRNFYDGVNDFNIGMFIHDAFHERGCTMEVFKKLIEKMIIEAYAKDKSIKDWRNQYTFERNGKKYIPLCRIEKINHETEKAYLVFFDQWIPKSLAYMDDKYIFCEEWRYKKIGKIKNE
ncbi:MAG: hypothetical protein E3J90_08895 [Promethearchaeota archaeon]|nr:MAG: hypothetical protein E3J90_08895 [Candidatus Lokiarchaeota archaeon]